MIALLVALVLSGPALTRPRLELTPGVTRALTRETVCATRWGLDRRAVTEGMKKRVAVAYGIPWAQHARYEFDHFIPRELGGADDERNLWPQPWTGDYNAHLKDQLENALHRQVCAGAMTLEAAQTAIRTDWIAAFRLYVTVKPATPRHRSTRSATAGAAGRSRDEHVAPARELGPPLLPVAAPTARRVLRLINHATRSSR